MQQFDRSIKYGILVFYKRYFTDLFHSVPSAISGFKGSAASCSRRRIFRFLAVIIGGFQECSLIMEAERINQIDASLIDLAERASALRGYL